MKAIEKIKGAAESGQIRRFTGNDYANDLTSGNVVAVIGWSGDAVQLQADNPNLEWRMPTEGCMLWSEDMVIPVGAPNPTAAEAFMNYVYDPKVAGQDRRLRQLRDAGRRRQGDLRKERSGTRRKPPDLPERVVHQEVLADADARRRRGTERDPGVQRGAERLSPMVRRRAVPYFLLGPGTIWLVLFFVVPLYYLGKLSLESGFVGSLEFSWNWSNYSEALSPTTRSSSARSSTPARRPLLALLLAYPLAYVIAFKAGRWRNVLLFAVIAPFFTTYLIRTIAWETILSDDSPVVELPDADRARPGGHVLDTAAAVIAGLTYNFLPFMILPIYASLERIDAR